MRETYRAMRWAPCESTPRRSASTSSSATTAALPGGTPNPQSRAVRNARSRSPPTGRGLGVARIRGWYIKYELVGLPAPSPRQAVDHGSGDLAGDVADLL